MDKINTELAAIGEAYLFWLTARSSSREAWAELEQYREVGDEPSRVPTKREWDEQEWVYFRKYQDCMVVENLLFQALCEKQDIVLANLALEGYQFDSSSKNQQSNVAEKQSTKPLYDLVWAVCNIYKDKTDDFIVSVGNVELVLPYGVPECVAKLSEPLSVFRRDLALMDKEKLK